MDGWLLPLSILPFIYAVVLYVGHAWRRMRRLNDGTAEASVRFVRYHVGLELVLGIVWTALLVGLNAVADD